MLRASLPSLIAGPSDFDPELILRWKLLLLDNALSAAIRLTHDKSEATEGAYTKLTGLLQAGHKYEVLDFLVSFAPNHCRKLIEEQKTAAALAWGRVSYIAERQLNHAWLDLFEVMKLASALKNRIYKDCRHTTRSACTIPRHIVQWTHDIPMEKAGFNDRISWARNNPDYEFQLFDDNSAGEFIRARLGQRTYDAYLNAPTESLKSRIFGLSFLWLNGGLHPARNQVAHASARLLLPSGADLVLRRSEGRPSVVNPSFIASIPRHPFVGRLLRHVVCGIEWMKSTGNSPHEWVIAGPGGLTMALLDDWCETGEWREGTSLRFLDEGCYAALVGDSDIDSKIRSSRSLNDHPNTNQLPTIPVRLMFAPEASLFYAGPDTSTRATILFPEAVLPPGNQIHIISANPADQSWVDDNARPKLAPEAGVYWLENVSLSGHGCLWKNNEFIQLDSYLSHVAEDETRRGAWPTPWTHPLTRTIDEPVIVAFTAGYACYGHWLVDDLPRIEMVRSALKNEFPGTKLIFPKKIRKWGLELLKFFFDVEDNQIIFFDHEQERLFLKHAIVPSFLHRNYSFQPFTREALTRHAPRDVRPHRKICLSRRSWDEKKADQRIFAQRALFESLAVEHDFELVTPEKLSFADQIRLMAETAIQIGEHGSAQHASIFSPNPTIVGSIGPLTPVQVNLGRIAGDHNVLLFPDKSWRDEDGSLRFSCDENRIHEFFSLIDEVR